MTDVPDPLHDLRDRARALVDGWLVPLERELVDGTASEEQVLALQAAAKEVGLWQYDVPTRYGGGGHGLLAACVVEEELGQSWASPFRGNTLLGPTVRPVLYALDDEQQQRYLYPVLRGEKRTCFAQSEQGAGTDPGSMTTTAVLHGEEYRLTGSKRWIGHAGTADFAQVVCRTGTGPSGRAILSVLLVDMDSPGVEVTRMRPTMMGDAPYEIRFEDVRVPAANLVAREGAGAELSQAWVNRNRIAKHGARSIGMATRAFEMAVGYARGRETFGRPLSERQAIQFMVADSAVQLQTARLLVHEAARRFDAGDDITDLAYMAKIHATEAAYEVVDRSMQILGGLGLSTALPVEYFFRQLRSIRITEGATEVLRWTLGKRVIRSTDSSRWPLPDPS